MHRAHRVRLVAAVLLVAALAAPASATGAGAPAPSNASPAEEQAGRPGDRFPTAVPERRTPPREPSRTPSSAATAAARSEAMATLADDYYDECDDVGAGDIARFGMSDDGGAEVSFVWTTCVGKPMRYAEDEFVVFSIDADVSDPTFRDDFVVAQWMDGYYEVNVTYNGAPIDEWRMIDSGYGVIDRSDPGSTFGGFTIDAASAGFPYEYHFAFQTFDGAGVRDVIPNPGHPAPAFPSRCDTYLLATGSRTAAAPAGAVVNDPEPTQWAIDQLNLAPAWAARPAARVEIAIVDSGIDATRPDLAGRVATGFDAVAGRVIPAGANSAFHPHGTAVAGIAAGDRDNGREIAGVNDGAVVRPYRVTGHNGPCVEPGAVAAALDHIATVDSIRIVNLSLGGTEMEPAVRDAVRRVAATGKILVAASGNDGPTPRANYPASLPEVIAVGATGAGRTVAPYSQPANTEVVAPGGDGHRREDGVAVLDERDGVLFDTGTSYAAPYVSGALSLWLNGARATTDEARAALRGAVSDLPGTTADGYGLLDVARLVGAGKRYPTPTARDVGDTCDAHQARRFDDTAGTAHEYTINCVAGRDITTGRTATTYEPAGPLSRGQTATFLVRTLEAAAVEVPGPTDVCSETDVHAVNVERLVAAGIVPAPADRRCLTTSHVTREVMASWTRGALAIGGVTSSDTTDWYGDDDASRYEAHIGQITALGIVTGKGGGRFGPTETLTRGQMATFLARTLDALEG